MTFFLDLTRHTVVVDVHAVSVGPEVPSNVTDVFTIHPLGVCLPLSFYRRSGPPVVCYVRLMGLLGQGGNGCGEVSDRFALSHHGIYVGCSCCRWVNEGIVSPVHLSQVVCSVLTLCRSGDFLLSFELTMRCLKVRLEVCPDFFGPWPVVPFVSVVIK